VNSRIFAKAYLPILEEEFRAEFARWSWGLARFEPIAKLGDPGYVMPESLK
jgi:hypothetical protein